MNNLFTSAPSSRKRPRVNYEGDDPRDIGDAPQPAANARHNPHVRQACNTCRSQKHKCDGAKPVCGPCAHLSIPCHYSAEADLRTKSGRQLFKQLEEQLAQEKRKNQELQREMDDLRKEFQGVQRQPAPASSRRLSVASDTFQPWSLDGHLSPSSPTSSAADPCKSWRLSSKHDDNNDDDAEDGPLSDFNSCSTRAIRLNEDEEIVSLASFSPLSMTRCVSPLPELENPFGELSVAVGDTFHSQENDYDNGLRFDSAGQYDSNCGMSWSIYIASKIPDIVQELNRQEHDRLLDQYLDSCQVSVLKTRFRVDMARMLAADHADPKPHCFNNSLYSPALHCAILAAAIALEPAARNHSQLSRWFERLRTAADDLRSEQFKVNAATASTAHTMSILAQLFAAEPTGARMAYLTLRRASELVRTNGAAKDPLMRWCEASLFVQGVDISLHTGFLPESAPSICLESLQMLPTDLQDENASDVRAFIARAELMDIVSRFVAAQGNRTASPFNLQAYRQELSDWRSQLGPFHEHNSSDRNVLLLHLTCAWAEMLLVRPMYWHTGPPIRQISDDACRQFMQLVDEFGRNHGLDKSPVRLVSMLFFIGIATLVATLSLDPSENFRRKLLVVQAKSAIQALNTMAQTKPCAQLYSDTLSNRLKEVQKRYTMSGVRGQTSRAKSLSSRNNPRGLLNPDRGRTIDRNHLRRKSITGIGPMTLQGGTAVQEDLESSIDGVQTFLAGMHDNPTGVDGHGGEGERWLYKDLGGVSGAGASTSGIAALEPIYEGVQLPSLSVLSRHPAFRDAPSPSFSPQNVDWNRHGEHSGLVPPAFQSAYGHSVQQNMPQAPASQLFWGVTSSNLVPSHDQHFNLPISMASTSLSAAPYELHHTPNSADGPMNPNFRFSQTFAPVEVTITDPNLNIVWQSTPQSHSLPRNYA